MAGDKYQLIYRPTGVRIGLPRDRKAVVEAAVERIERPPGYQIISYPPDWQEQTGEVYVGLREPGEDVLPVEELDTYPYLVRPAGDEDLAQLDEQD